MPLDKDLRIAIVHHWFLSHGGGEKIAEIFAGMYPSADIFTLLSDTAMLQGELRQRTIRQSFLGKLPGARKVHRYLLPLYPLAANSLDLTAYDLILSSDSGPVKGIRTAEKAIHICYCHSPMRYLWDLYDPYAASMNFVTRSFFGAVRSYVREWDFQAAQKVTHFLANSENVAQRIRQSYRRPAEVIYPGIEARRGRISPEISDSYLYVGRLVSYKRVDLLIEACNRLKRKLKIVGIGPEFASLKSRAGETVELLGWQPSERVWEHYSQCRAFLFAAEEDCGMAPLEAQACGRPVLAYGKGGSLETVAGWNGVRSPGEAPTGLFFWEQSVEAVMEAILQFERQEQDFESIKIQERALRFDVANFTRQIDEFVSRSVPYPLDAPLVRV